jgi:hypothetical protein
VKQTCACLCGASRFAVSGEPIGRFFCHCTICQTVCRKPFADATYFWARSIRLPEGHNIQFRRYRSPPALNRGICPRCDNPAVAFISVGPLSVFFVQSQNFQKPAELPPPDRHIFYERRVADVPDAIPKISGYWSSEAYVVGTVLGALFRSSSD